MFSRRHVPMIALFACGGLLVAGCGGDDDSSTDSAPDADALSTEDGGSDGMDGSGDTTSGETTGGTATVVVDGVTYEFASDEPVTCRELFGVLSIDLPVVSVDGTPVDGDADQGNLKIEMLPADTSGGDYEDIYENVRLDLPQDGGIWLAADGPESEYVNLGYIGTGALPEITLERDGLSASGTQVLGHNSVEQSGTTIEIDVDAACAA